MERYYLDPQRADFDDPEGAEGITMHTGEWIPLGNVLAVLSQVGLPWHQLVKEFERYEAPRFRNGHWCTQGLWTFPQWYILVTTYHIELSPVARAFDVSQVPYTTVDAIPRRANAAPPDCLRRILAAQA